MILMTTMKDLASISNDDDEEYNLKWVKSLDELEDLPLYDCFKDWVKNE